MSRGVEPVVASAEELGVIVRDLVRPLSTEEVAVLFGCKPQTIRDRWKRQEFPEPMNPDVRRGHRWAPGSLRRIVVDGIPYNALEAHLAKVRPIVDGARSA